MSTAIDRFRQDTLGLLLHNPFLLTHSTPLKFVNTNWPDIRLYDKQVEIIESVRDNDWTIVPAGNDLGKDFIAALTALWFFCSRSPCFVVTSSVDASQLDAVLWGEMRRFIRTSKYKLPIYVNHRLIRQTTVDGGLEDQSRLEARCVAEGEGLLGRHIPRQAPHYRPMTLVIFDEASGMSDDVYDTADTWAHRGLVIGNPYPCENFFKRFVEQGDVSR